MQFDLEKWLAEHAYTRLDHFDNKVGVVSVDRLRALLKGKVLCDATPDGVLIEDTQGAMAYVREPESAGWYHSQGRKVSALYRAADAQENQQS